MTLRLLFIYLFICEKHLAGGNTALGDFTFRLSPLAFWLRINTNLSAQLWSLSRPKTIVFGLSQKVKYSFRLNRS